MILKNWRQVKSFFIKIKNMDSITSESPDPYTNFFNNYSDRLTLNMNVHAILDKRIEIVFLLCFKIMLKSFRYLDHRK